jgi:hypothetical protein
VLEYNNEKMHIYQDIFMIKILFILYIFIIYKQYHNNVVNWENLNKDYKSNNIIKMLLILKN